MRSDFLGKRVWKLVKIQYDNCRPSEKKNYEGVETFKGGPTMLCVTRIVGDSEAN
jgi:hypothetical protein